MLCSTWSHVSCFCSCKMEPQYQEAHIDMATPSEREDSRSTVYHAFGWGIFSQPSPPHLLWCLMGQSHITITQQFANKSPWGLQDSTASKVFEKWLWKIHCTPQLSTHINAFRNAYIKHKWKFYKTHPYYAMHSYIFYSVLFSLLLYSLIKNNDNNNNPTTKLILQFPNRPLPVLWKTPAYINENLPKSCWRGVNSGIISGQRGKRGNSCFFKTTNTFLYLCILGSVFITSPLMILLTQHLFVTVGMFQLTAEKTGVFIYNFKK